jgi:predicted nucleic acid-binding protein
LVAGRIAPRHQRVLLDTCLWIYHFGQNATFGKAADYVIEQLEAGKFQAVASELTLMELIVKPLQVGRQDAADDYETLLSHFPNLTLEPISREILLEAAALRARYRVRTPDAIQLATAFKSHATLAITNDEGWRNIAGMETLLLAELVAER